MKLLRFQRTFLEKSFVSGFGAEAPTDNATQKSTAMPCFLICQNMLELRYKPPFLTFLERKVSQRTSHRIYHFILVKLLRFQRTFPEKSFVSGFGAEAPTDNTTQKSTASPCFLIFISRNFRRVPISETNFCRRISRFCRNNL